MKNDRLTRFRMQEVDGSWYRRDVLCREACPVHTHAGGYVQAIARGDVDTAAALARAPNPFANVCSRVCAHPCESACRRAAIDAPVSIRALKRAALEQSRSGRTPPSPAPRPDPTRRVAVVGGGPAGLSCAHDLARIGHRVVLFEKAPVLGGMLRLGIPEYRLPRELLQEEIDGIVRLGVEVRTDQALGRDFRLADLRREGFDAVFLSVGAHRSRDLAIPGTDLDGVLRGVEFLLNVNLGFRVWLGHRVIVIGGGSVAIDVARTASREEVPFDEGLAMDAARSALRLGAREVHVVCLEPREQMPAHQYEVDEADEEGISFHPSRGPRRILGVQGRVTGLETLRCARVFDSEGRFAPEFVAGSEEVIGADTVILAIGQETDVSWIDPEDGIEVTRGGLLRVDPETLETTAPAVFAGGDAAFGPRLVIDAVADGRRAAASIVAGIERRRIPASGDAGRLVAIRPRDLDDGYDGAERRTCPTLPVSRRIGFTEVELAFPVDEARHEAERCLRCEQHIILDPSRCILCGGCVDVCPYRCIQVVSLDRIEGDSRELMEARHWETGVAFLLEGRQCIRCALCVRRCPTDALTLARYDSSTLAVREDS